MTQLEKGIFIRDNFQNLPLLSNGSYYHARWIIKVSSNNTVFKLYEDTEHSSTYNNNVLTTDRNYSFYTSDIDNGSIPMVYKFDISFLFKDTFISQLGCQNLHGGTAQEDNAYFIQTMDTSDEQEWTIANNGIQNSDYTVERVSISTNVYTAYTPIDITGKEFYSLSQAQDYVRTQYINDGYPTYQGNNVFTKFNQLLRDYVTCTNANKNKCCLELC